MSREWLLYLEDLIVFCERVLNYTEGRTREEIESDAMRYDAVLRNIELIGEAVRALPDHAKSLEPQIPWNEMAGMRNVLAHAYFGVDQDVVWDVVSVEITPLLAALRRIQGKSQRQSPRN